MITRTLKLLNNCICIKQNCSDGKLNELVVMISERDHKHIQKAFYRASIKKYWLALNVHIIQNWYIDLKKGMFL